MLAKTGLREIGLKLGLAQVGHERRVDLSFKILNRVLELGQCFTANRVISSGAAVEKQALFSHNTDDFSFSHGKVLYCGKSSSVDIQLVEPSNSSS
jgi:hypothetical protein